MIKDNMEKFKFIIKYFVLLIIVVLATVLFKQCTGKKIEPIKLIAN